MQPPDPEVLAKHFEEGSNLTIQPGKAQVAAMPSARQLKTLIEEYFYTRKSIYFNTFQNGKLLANMSDYKSPVDVLHVIGMLLTQGIKNANARGGISNETLPQYFINFKLALELLETNIKNLAEQKKENPSTDTPSQQEFDTMELLAILCGFLVTKLND